MKCGVVLWSGGLDSTSLICYLLRKGYIINPLFIDRGQSNLKYELNAVCTLYPKIKEIFPKKFKALRKHHLIIPSAEIKKEFKKQSIIKKYFLRNDDLINDAIRLALCINCNEIFLGSNVDDIAYPEDHPDNTTLYFKLKNELLKQLLEFIKSPQIITIRAPFIEEHMEKSQVLKYMRKNFPEIDLDLTRSCYSSSEKPCGECDACKERKKIMI